MPSNRKQRQYQILSAPIGVGAAAPAEVISWQQPQSQPRNSILRRVRNAALIASLPFFFAPPIPSAQAATQPQDSVSQPIRKRPGIARIAPSFFAPPASDTDAKPLFSWPQPSRARPRPQYAYYFAPISADISAPSGVPEVPTYQPSRSRIDVSDRSAYFAPFEVIPGPPPAPGPPPTYTRRDVPDTAYTPCGGILVGEIFSHLAAPSTSFDRRTVPEVEYVDCGTELPGKVILLVPGMVMRLSDG